MNFTLKNSVNPVALLPADFDRFAPGERSLEKQEVGVMLDKSILNRATDIIDALGNLFPVMCRQRLQCGVGQTVELDQKLQGSGRQASFNFGSWFFYS